MDTAYQEKSNLWQIDEPRFMADFVGKPQITELLGNVAGQTIWDAGAGNGSIARKLAARRGIVYCSERDKACHEQAQAQEKSFQMGIKYKLEDMCWTEYPDNYFHKVICEGALKQSNERELRQFMLQASRKLLEGGYAFISIIHPFMYTEDSPSRKPEPSWLRHDKIHWPGDGSKPFLEHYFDKDGREFESKVWNHPIEVYDEAIRQAGLQKVLTQELKLEKEHLESKFWGTEYGYPAFLQMVLRKG